MSLKYNSEIKNSINIGKSGNPYIVAKYAFGALRIEVVCPRR